MAKSKKALKTTRIAKTCGEFESGETNFIDLIKDILPVRAYSALRKLNITTKDSFMKLTQIDCLKLKNCGPKTWLKIKQIQDVQTALQNEPLPKK